MKHRKTSLAIGAALALLLGLLITTPLLLRGRVDAWLQDAITARLDARVSWESAGISLLRSFPHASLGVEGVRIIGQDRFEADTLASIPRLSVSVDLISLVQALRGSGPLVVRSVAVDRPALHLRVLEDGARNWEVLPASGDTPGAEPLAWTLRDLRIRGARILYEDSPGRLTASLAGVEHSLRGDFRQERFALEGRLGADSVSVRFAGIPYLSQARLEGATVLEVDSGRGAVTIRSGELALNDLHLALSGGVELGEEATRIDLAFEAPDASVRELLSLITPLDASGELARAESSGTISVQGRVRGDYGAEAFPSLEMEARIEDGSLRYPELPLPIRELALDLAVRNPGGSADSTRVELRRFRAVAGASPIEGSFTLATPLSDPAIALQASGRLDLAEWRQAVPLAVEEFSGVVVGEARIEARASDLEAARYDRIIADGALEISQLALSAEALPHPLAIEQGRLQLSPRFAELSSLRAQLGSSDLALDGRLENPLGSALLGEDLRGTIELRSRSFDLNEWRSDEELQRILIPDRVDLLLTAAIDRLAFADLDLRNARGRVQVRDQRASLEGFALELFGGSLEIDGSYETTDPERPAFDVEMRLTGIEMAAAGAELATMSAFAPAIRYARGRLSTDVQIRGVLGEDMAPILGGLSGQGSFSTDGLALQDFPALARLADELRTEWLREPALSDIRASFQILDGRLHLRPFEVRLGEIATRVAGSQGIDQTMEYALELRLPRALLGAGANQVITSLADRAAGAGIALAAAEEIHLGARLTGTVTQPALALDFRGTSAADALRTTLYASAERGIEAMEARADSVVRAARERAEEEADRIIAEAERQAEVIRAQARELAERARLEGYERADRLGEQGAGAIERRLAEAGAERLRAETDRRTGEIVREADSRAESLVQMAREQAEGIRRRAPTEP